MSRRLAFSTISVLILLVLAGCTQTATSLPPAQSNVVRVVSSLPTRGASAAQTTEITEAIRLAIDTRGGLAGGYRIEYVALEGGSEETGEWSRERELDNAETATSDPSVVAYIGPYNSGAVQVSLPLTNRADLLQASPSATWPGLTLSGWDPGEPERYYPFGTRNFVRLIAPDTVQAVAAAHWAESLGRRRVAVIDDGSTYSLGMGRVFSETARSLNIDVPQQVHLPAPLTSIIRLDLSDADAVYYAPSSVRSAIAVAGGLKGSGLPVFATDTALDDQFAESVGDAAKSWHITSNSSTSVDTEASGEPRFRSRFAAFAFELTNIILDGLDTGAGRDRLALLSYVKTAALEGPTGEGRIFTADGDPVHWTITGYAWGGNQFVPDRTFTDEP